MTAREPIHPGEDTPLPPTVARCAHAKVNLALAVSPPIDAGEKRGWHEICSWMAAVSLHDTLTLRPRGPGYLSAYAIHWAPDAPRPTPIDWPLAADLAVRAHCLLQDEQAGTLPLQARLEKRTPTGGGLGGGSSDAAAMLLAASHAFGLGIDHARLRALSARLGSDVAFFLDDAPTDAPRPAVVEGFGDRVARAPAHAHEGVAAVLAFPPFGCATPAVYRAFDAVPNDALARSGGPGDFDDRAQRVRDLAARGLAVGAELFNDLAPAAEAVAPELASLRSALARALGEPVHVTGSGSTVFALARDPDHAAWAAARGRDALAHEGVALAATTILA